MSDGCFGTDIAKDHATRDHPMLAADHNRAVADPFAAMLADLPPVDAALAALRGKVLLALRQRDCATLWNALEQAASLPCETSLRAVWLPIALGISAWETIGNPLPDAIALGRQVRAQTRVALLDMPAWPVSRWLVPSTLHDTTTAHLAVLALSLRGMGARVWTWPLPPPGPVLLVGDASSALAAAGRIPTLAAEPGWPTLAALVA